MDYYDADFVVYMTHDYVKILRQVAEVYDVDDYYNNIHIESSARPEVIEDEFFIRGRNADADLQPCAFRGEYTAEQLRDAIIKMANIENLSVIIAGSKDLTYTNMKIRIEL